MSHSLSLGMSGTLAFTLVGGMNLFAGYASADQESPSMVQLGKPAAQLRVIGSVPERGPVSLQLGELRTDDAALPPRATTIHHRMKMRAARRLSDGAPKRSR